MIDPSLFTLPYDLALVDGLTAAGQDVTLHGRPLEARDGDVGDHRVMPSFYKASGSWFGRRVPRAARLGLKGVDHAVSLARLSHNLGRVQPDIIHFQWLPLPIVDRFMLGAFRKIAPVFLTVHDTNAFNGDPSARLQGAGFANALASCDRLIVHTQQGAARLRDLGLGASKIAVLPHGLLGSVCSKHNAPETVSRFVLFGKIKPYKGADILINAFADLAPPVRQRASILIIGQAHMPLEPLRQLARARGVADQVTIEDRFVPDTEVTGLFSPGSVAVFPYREIEASGVLSLALAHGRPIIASRLGSFAESLTDGVHGRILPPEDVGALSAAMAQMIESPQFAAAAGAASSALAHDVPGWDDIGRMTVQLYEECLSARGTTVPQHPICTNKEITP